MPPPQPKQDSSKALHSTAILTLVVRSFLNNDFELRCWKTSRVCSPSFNRMGLFSKSHAIVLEAKQREWTFWTLWVATCCFRWHATAPPEHDYKVVGFWKIQSFCFLLYSLWTIFLQRFCCAFQGNLICHSQLIKIMWSINIGFLCFFSFRKFWIIYWLTSQKINVLTSTNFHIQQVRSVNTLAN